MGEPAAHNVADVCIGAQCPSYQETKEMIVAPFLQRGCSRALPRPPEELRHHRLLVGFTPEGLPCVARIDPRLRQWTTDDTSIRSFSPRIFTSLWGGQDVSCHFAPLSTLLTAKRLRDLEAALWASRKGITDNNIDSAAEQKSEQDALIRLGRDGLDQAAREFQNANPTTYILRIQLIHAALMYFWVKSSKNLRGEAARPDNPYLKGYFVPDLAMGVFLAYFPTWLKFHELFRLGAYIHPFDFISSVYSGDLKASDQYFVHGASWEAKFGALKDFEDPFALLTPAMQEGSALGGPFLPLECTLSEVHHLEVHGPPVTPQPSQTLHTTLKRRATDDLYHPGTPKKMKTAAETHLNLEGLDANDAGRVMGYAHKEVLGFAAMAGLLNPTHFEVGPSGTIGLTASGLMAAAGPDLTAADPKAYEDLERRRCALMATEVRYFMHRGGFWEDGHASMVLLTDMLDEKFEVAPEDLLGHITAMYELIADPLADLLDTVKTLKNQRHEPMSEEMKTSIMGALNVLYSQHEGDGPSPATLLRVANTHPGRPRLEMAQYLVGIAEKYLNMVIFSDGILKCTKCTWSGPVENAQQLARSLAQQKQLSTGIQGLLDADGDEC
ncbi:hypothetical protein NCS55_00155000 [Fusarium keratoplasticum]|nr:hypothetical protein NCS55_00155000 [Fusarium keratoplasticum]